MALDTSKYVVTVPSHQHVDSGYRLFCTHRKVPWSLDLFRQSLLSPHCRVCMLDNELVGFLIINPIASEAELEEICVDARFRQQGIAKTMLLSAFEQLAKTNITKLQLEVREKNTAAITLYKSLGFDLSGRRKNYYNDCGSTGEDALIFTLIVGHYT